MKSQHKQNFLPQKPEEVFKQAAKVRTQAPVTPKSVPLLSVNKRGLPDDSCVCGRWLLPSQE